MRCLFYKPGASTLIEVHYRLGSGRIGDILPEDAVWDHAEQVEADGLAVRLLGPTARIIHNAVSALLSEAEWTRMVVGECRFRLYHRGHWIFDISHPAKAGYKAGDEFFLKKSA